MAEREKPIPSDRLKKVMEIKRQVKEGKYRVDPDAVSDGILGLVNRDKPTEKHPSEYVLVNIGRKQPVVTHLESNKPKGWSCEPHPDAPSVQDSITKRVFHYRPLEPGEKAEITSLVRKARKPNNT